MRKLTLVLLSPIVAPYLAVRFMLRLGAKIVLPFELVFMLFGFGIAWCIFHAWSLVYPEDAASTNWKTWGRHMTEAGFDTLATFVLLWLYCYFVLNRDLAADADKLFGDMEAAAWIPFWLAAQIPFCIRLHFADEIETLPAHPES